MLLKNNRFMGAAVVAAMLVSGAVGIAASPAQANVVAYTVDSADPLGGSAAKALPKPPKVTNPLPAVAGGVKAPKRLPGSSAASSKGVTASVTGGPYYYYNVGSQGFSSGTLPNGVAANFSVNTPSVPYLNSANDYHTLAEAAVQKTIAGAQQTIEAGWTVDPVVNSGDATHPHIFVHWWKNGVGTCYNGCGWTPYSGASYTVGQTISSSTTGLKFQIQYDSGLWWVGAWVASTGVGSWMGYFPGTLWTNSNTYGTAVSGFTDADFVQVFGEVAANNSSAALVCSSMGSDTLATSTAGASIGTVTYPNLVGSTVNMYWHEDPTGISPYWNAEGLSLRTMRYGGPGGC